MSGTSLEARVGELLHLRGLRLAVAESCTGGLLGHRLTNVAGSSTYFVGGLIAYANEAKVKLLGVHQETLDKYGAVSRETVLEMARGARRQLEADIGLAVTGIAGPSGGTPDKPVGLTWIGLSTQSLDDARRFVWQGDRLSNKEQSAQAGLNLLMEFLLEKEPLWDESES